MLFMDHNSGFRALEFRIKTLALACLALMTSCKGGNLGNELSGKKLHLLPSRALAPVNLSSNDSMQILFDNISLHDNTKASMDRNVTIPQPIQGQTLPATINDCTVQANSMVVDGNYAFVAYNAEGPYYAGALQILKLDGLNKPLLLKEVHFSNMEVDNVQFNRNTQEVVFGGQADGSYFGFYRWTSRAKVDSVSSKAIVENLKSVVLP